MKCGARQGAVSREIMGGVVSWIGKARHGEVMDWNAGTKVGRSRGGLVARAILGVVMVWEGHVAVQGVVICLTGHEVVHGVVRAVHGVVYGACGGA